MFDRRIISGKRHLVVALLDHGNEALAANIDPNYVLSSNFYVKNILLFDYLFAAEYNYTRMIDNPPDSCRWSGRYVSKQVEELVVEKVLPSLSHSKFDEALPLCGAYLTTVIDELDIKSFHIALFVPSQPYDTCTMNWSAYYTLFLCTEVSDIYDVYAQYQFIAGESSQTELYDTDANRHVSINSKSIYSVNNLIYDLDEACDPTIQRMGDDFIRRIYGPYTFNGITYLSDVFNGIS